MRSFAAQQPFVALGGASMMVLEYAYAAAARSGAESASTLHVLAQIAVHERLAAPWLLDAFRGGLAVMAADTHRTPPAQAVGEVAPPVVVDEFDAEARASLREVVWWVRRMAGRWGLSTSDLAPARHCGRTVRWRWWRACWRLPGTTPCRSLA
jgi:hypothetical protein